MKKNSQMKNGPSVSVSSEWEAEVCVRVYVIDRTFHIRVNDMQWELMQMYKCFPQQMEKKIFP